MGLTGLTYPMRPAEYRLHNCQHSRFVLLISVANRFTDILTDILRANISQGTLILCTVVESVNLEHIFSALHSKSN